MWKKTDDNTRTLRIWNTAAPPPPPPPPPKKNYRPRKAYDEETLYSNGVRFQQNFIFQTTPLYCYFETLYSLDYFR